MSTEHLPARTREIVGAARHHGAAMSPNMGPVDRIVRVVVGSIPIAYAVPLGLPQTGWNWVGWIGVLPLVTAIIGRCPLYSVLVISTCRASALQCR
jgi:Inner membrane protein YgaP-like, transmembrane domain